MTALLNPNHDRWQFDYDNGDHLLAQTDYAGRRTQYGYDRLGQLIQIIECSLAAGSELTAPLHMRLAYDAPGRITLRRATGEREHAFLFERRYLWDRQDQLVQQMFTEDGIGQPGPQCLQSRFGYDARGQLTHSIQPHQEERFHYDAAGNRTDSSSATVWHNLLQRLVSICREVRLRWS